MTAGHTEVVISPLCAHFVIAFDACNAFINGNACIFAQLLDGIQLSSYSPRNQDTLVSSKYLAVSINVEVDMSVCLLRMRESVELEMPTARQ